MTSGGDPRFAANAARELAQLEALVAEMRERLDGLRRDVADAETVLGSTKMARIVEANEQLVLAAMRAQAETDTAAQTLDEMSRLAHVDALTGLPNRAVLLDRLANAIPNATRRGVRLALLYLDLNDFKEINDTLGHAVGDRVLKMVADRLAGAVREGDTVSRHGGDEFVFLLTEVTEVADAVLVADKLIAALVAPSPMEGHVLRLTASIGISLYPDDGEDAPTLMHRADTAMYRAKRQGLGSVVFSSEASVAERQLNPPGLASLHRPLTSLELALAEHERLNSQLREANEQLVVAALGASELQAAAQQALQRQTEFLARVAHELRNPLAPIRNAVAVMGQPLTNETTLRRMQVIIERQVGHLTRLIGDVVDVTRVGIGKLRIERRPVDIVDIVDQAIHASRPAMDTRLQTFIVELPAFPLQVHGDPTRLSQVISNLLDNASKYTPDGGSIHLSVERSDEAIVITVSDTGIGITADVLPQVFEPFVQDDHAIGFNGVGLGIGLTVVRDLVNAHGGTIVACSDGKDLGSRFVVSLPLPAPGPEADGGERHT
ncbi:MAG: diguanylate cyclase domain-containing protein [Caldimonas sp.]